MVLPSIASSSASSIIVAGPVEFRIVEVSGSSPWANMQGGVAIPLAGGHAPSHEQCVLFAYPSFMAEEQCDTLLALAKRQLFNGAGMHADDEELLPAECEAVADFEAKVASITNCAWHEGLCVPHLCGLLLTVTVTVTIFPR